MRRFRGLVVPGLPHHAAGRGNQGNSSDVPDFPECFFNNLSVSSRFAVDTGFLEAVRTVDLRNKSVYEVGKNPDVLPPRAITQPLPAYTDAARSAGVDGFVQMKCVVLEDGTVTNCKLKRTAGYGIDESVLLTVQNFR